MQNTQNILVSARPTRYETRSLYLALAVAAAIVAFAGFARSYYLKALFGSRPLPLVLHVHGLIMSAWLAIFIVQTWLIAVYRVQWHRRLGIAAAVLAVGIIALGAWLTVAARIPQAPDGARGCDAVGARRAAHRALFSHSVVSQFLAFYACLGACVIVDTVRHQRLHPVFGWGALFILAAWQLVYTLEKSDAWLPLVAKMFGS